MGRAHEVRKESIAKTAAKKSKLYARYGKEIYQVAKGSPNPEVNLELKRIIELARKDQVPKEIIERAIEKAKGGVDENYIPTRYEFLGPGNSYFIVECLTDTPARTIANVRNCFTKTGGKSGSVLHLFEQKAIFSFSGISEEELLELFIENDLDDVDFEFEEGFITVLVEPLKYYEVKQLLVNKFNNLEFEIDEIRWLPLSYQELNKTDYQSFLNLLELLDDDEDVVRVYYNVSKQN